MKKIVILFIFILSCATFTPQELTQQDIIDFPNMTKNQLFEKTNEWIASSFASYKSVVQYADKEGGMITGIIVTPSSGLDLANYESLIKIECKDNKVRFTIQVQSRITYNGQRHAITGTKDYALDSIRPIKSLYIDFVKRQKKDNW